MKTPNAVATQDALLTAQEALQRIAEMSVRFNCACGRPTGTGAIKSCADRALESIRTPSPTPGKSDRGELLDRMAHALRQACAGCDVVDRYTNVPGATSELTDQISEWRGFLAEYDTLRASPAESCAESVGNPDKHDIGSVYEQAEAWETIVAMLDEIAPGWNVHDGVHTGTNMACVSIRKLLQQTQPSAAGDADAWTHEYGCLRAVYEAARKYLRNEAEPAKAKAARVELDSAIEDVKEWDGGTYDPPASLPDKSAVTDAAVQLLRDIRWKSADRDNMEFTATITYSQMDRIEAMRARTAPSVQGTSAASVTEHECIHGVDIEDKCSICDTGPLAASVGAGGAKEGGQ